MSIIGGQNAGRISIQVANGLVVWIQPNNALLVLAFHRAIQYMHRAHRGTRSTRVSGPSSQPVHARLELAVDELNVCVLLPQRDLFVDFARGESIRCPYFLEKLE
jgi:hypothetical protein